MRCRDKEIIMSQNQQLKKVKRYRILKAMFYFLGFPLFVLATFLTSIQFIGNDPFVGTSDFTSSLGFFESWEELFTSPALFGVWTAFGLWALISIIHAILSKTVKSVKARMLGVTAFCVVVMLTGVVVIDSMFDMQINSMIAYEEEAGNGVVVYDYKTQLSYYDVVSTNAQGKNDTKNLIDQVDLLKDVYNVGMRGTNKGGVAANMSNKPISYYNIIADDGTVGVDISFAFNSTTGLWDLAIDGNNNLTPDGEITKEVEGNQLIRVAPDANGNLVLNGVTYSHYFVAERVLKSGETIYTWYTKDMMPANTTFDPGEKPFSHIVEGTYGRGIYNESGLLFDGWILGLDNVLEILSDYYEGQALIAQYDPDGSYGEIIREAAREMRDAYYNGEELEGGHKLDEATAAWMTALYNQESDLEARFSLTRGDLDFLISKLGGFLGSNSLFDFLLKPVEDGSGSGLENLLGNAGLGSVADMIAPILDQLATSGLSLGGLINNEGTMKTVIDIVKAAVDYDGEINDLYIMLAYGGKTDAMGKKHDGMYLAIVKDNGAGAIGTNAKHVSKGGDILIDIDFRDELLDEDESDYAFDFDHLSEFLNNTINGLLSHFNVDLKSILVDNTIGSLLGGLLIKDINLDGEVYKGLVISGISIPLFDQDYNAKIDIIGIVQNLLKGMYQYQSSVFKPVWEFYELIDTEDEKLLKAAAAYAQYERANYEATYHGSMIGSTIIGDTLGKGQYPSSFGLQNLQQVKQLQRDLSYKPVFYPLYAFRDMMLFFGALTIFFYFMSFVMSEKEKEYARGQVVVKEKKKKAKKNKNGEDADKQAGDVSLKEITALPQDQNNGKEVL